MSAQSALIVDPLGLRLSAAEKRVFAQTNPFGFILFGRNIDSADQLRALCDELRSAVGREAIITIDQEGGRVQRLRPPIARDWLPPLEEAEANPALAAQIFELRYQIIGAELRALGIDSNCAPSGDIAGPDTHPFLRNRCYGKDPATVATLARAATTGLLAAGVLPIMKHMPGHGRSSLDSHFELPKVDVPIETLLVHDFAPFKALNDLPMGMTAHQVFTQIDAMPATLSPKMIRVIREKIGFDGLLMTDDMGMKALPGTPCEIATQAIAAGCDVVLNCNGDLAEKQAVAEAAGAMSDQAQWRGAAAIARRNTPDTLDISALEAKLAALKTQS